MSPEERKRYDKQRYQSKKEKIKAAARAYYAENRAKALATMADWREQHREEIRLANRLGVTVKAARQVASACDLLTPERGHCPVCDDWFVSRDDTNDAFLPSAGETPQQRVLKDHWREKLVNGFMDALATGDFGAFQQADRKLRCVLGSDEAKIKRDTALRDENIRRLSEGGSSIRSIAAVLDMPRTTVEHVIKRQRQEQPMARSLELIVRCDEREIASFDTSSRRFVTNSLHDPDAVTKANIIAALRRALSTAEDLWSEKSRPLTED